MAYLVGVPQWVWLAVACVAVEVGILWFALHEHARAERLAEDVRAARNVARLWQRVAEGRARAVHSKRTVVAPQFHAPRSGSAGVGGAG